MAWQAVILGDDEAVAERPEYRRWAALLISSTRDDALSAIGLDPDALAAVRAEIAKTGVEQAGASLSGADVRKLLLVGTIEQVRAQLRAVDGIGVDEVVCLVLGGEDEVRRTMERLASDVLPHVNAAAGGASR